jgi:hypothetical protein
MLFLREIHPNQQNDDLVIEATYSTQQSYLPLESLEQLG